MDMELRKQRIKSLIEAGGYADGKARGRISYWKWLTAITALVTLGQIAAEFL